MAALLGSLPPTLLYTVSGATVADLQSKALIFVLVMLIAGITWVAGRRLGKCRGGGGPAVGGKNDRLLP